MISRPEQQFVSKMKLGPELDALVIEHVCSFKKIKARLFFNHGRVVATSPWNPDWFDVEGNFIHIPNISGNANLALSLLSALEERSKISRSKDHEMWEIHIGSAKKITEMVNADLAGTLCKALIIYVRKFC